MASGLSGAPRSIIKILRKAAEIFIKISAHKLVRLSIFTLFLCLLVWLLYDRVWQSMRSEVPLPVGVTEMNPGLDLDMLSAINVQRVERTRYSPSAFEVAGRVLAIPRQKSQSEIDNEIPRIEVEL